MANFASLSNFGDPSSPQWQRENLVTIEPVPGQRWQVHRQAAPAFTGLLKDLAATGYQLRSSGGFNYRKMRGGTRLSQHAFGNAIDINAAANPMLRPGQRVVTDLPANTAELAAKHGLEWGGKWKRPDAMHFEWLGGGGGSQPIMVAAGGAGRSNPASIPQPGAAPAMGGTPGGPANVASLFSPEALAPEAMSPGLGGLALAAMQQPRQAARQAEAEAQRERRVALLSEVGAMFG